MEYFKSRSFKSIHCIQFESYLFTELSFCFQLSNQLTQPNGRKTVVDDVTMKWKYCFGEAVQNSIQWTIHSITVPRVLNQQTNRTAEHLCVSVWVDFSRATECRMPLKIAEIKTGSPLSIYTNKNSSDSSNALDSTVDYFARCSLFSCCGGTAVIQNEMHNNIPNSINKISYPSNNNVFACVLQRTAVSISKQFRLSQWIRTVDSINSLSLSLFVSFLSANQFSHVFTPLRNSPAPHSLHFSD